MKKLFYIFALLLFINSNAQCGISNLCNPNTGLYSNNDATNIAYDNMGSGFHATYIKDVNSVWKVWGESMANDGVSNVLSPMVVNSINYPALTGTIFKIGIGSRPAFFSEQLIVLTSTGLFVSGKEGVVMDNSITTSTTFQKITINGETDGLPFGINPIDVKMMFTTAETIMITTCTGAVFVLGQSPEIRGDGSTGNATQWSRVMENATTPLSNVIVARGNYQYGFALKADGTLWTWGSASFLGDGTPDTPRDYATQMTLPAGLPGIKMIQAAHFSSVSYYIIGTNKKLYTLGENLFGQLGDGSNIDKLSWVNAINPDNSIITDAAWISTNEHDDGYDAVALIKTGGLLYTAGSNSRYMVGRTIPFGINYFDIPAGVSNTDVITYAETGGHTCALIKQGSIRYGYVGHRVNGSVGDGSTLNAEISTYDFITPPIINVCGTNNCASPTISSPSICIGQDAVFTINGFFGDTISYNINGAAIQTVVIDNTNLAIITINNPTTNQTLNITQLINNISNCSLVLSLSNTITINPKITPTFNPIPPICFGSVAPILPNTAANGYTGTWFPPAINDVQSGSYQFTPAPNQCTNLPPPISITIYNDFNFEIIHKCVGNNYTLQIAPLNNSFDINTANFSWTNSSNFGVGNNTIFDVTNYLTTNNITPQFPLIYNAIVTLPNGCIKKKTTDLFSTFCEIQKGISPNNDGDNDFFDLRLLNVRQLKIYNRYGMIVYTLDNYFNQWIGQNDAGQELPSGTYYYVIEFNADKPAAVGWIYINRENK
jgi:gliding motility-associated-like protein